MGGLVGLKHVFADQIDEKESRIHIITDSKHNRHQRICTRADISTGSLVSLACSDHNLSAYGIIIVDEAHLHTVSTDLLLGFLKGVSVTRHNDLKIVIMTTPVYAESFKSFFQDSALVELPEKEYPVEISYLTEPVSSGDLVETIEQSIFYVHLCGKPGDILVFASGVDQINRITNKVAETLDPRSPRFNPRDIGPLTIHKLYDTLPVKEQQAVVRSVPPGPRGLNPGRNLFIATSMAESSIAFVGVAHVIDSMRVESKLYNPEDESHTLNELPISKAQAQQRASRAGRTGEGCVYRMCTQTDYDTQLTDHTVPDIQNGDMLSQILQIVKLGHNPFDFPYMSPLATVTVTKALSIHSELGTLELSNRGLELTSRGKNILDLPVSVFCANALLESATYNCVDEMISVVSMIEASEGGTCFFTVPETRDRDFEKALKETKSYFSQSNGDFLMLLNIYFNWRHACDEGRTDEWLRERMMVRSTLERADALRSRLLRIMATEQGREQFGWKESQDPTSPTFYTMVLCALAAGFHLQVAKRVPAAPKSPSNASEESEPELYDTVRQGIRAKLPNGQSFGPEKSDWVIYNELSKKGPNKAFLSLVSPVPLKILMKACPDYWSNVDTKPAGHIRDALVQKIMELTGLEESEITGEMQQPSQQQQQ